MMDLNPFVNDLSFANHALRIFKIAGRQWLTPAILATQEAEIRRIMVRSQPRQISKNPSQK
jgi:hypothetical protein